MKSTAAIVSLPLLVLLVTGWAVVSVDAGADNSLPAKNVEEVKNFLRSTVANYLASQTGAR